MKAVNRNNIKIVKYIISNTSDHMGYIVYYYYMILHRDNLKIFKFITKEFCGNHKPVSDIYGDTIFEISFRSALNSRSSMFTNTHFST